MSAVELKQMLISKIESLNDVATLNYANSLLDVALMEIELGIADDMELGSIELTEEQIAAIDEAEEQIKNGECYTEEEANDEIEEWLKKL